MLLLLPVQSFASCNIHDAQGNYIQLPNAAQRIISLAPDITEILFSIGAGSQIVGVVEGSDYPSAAQKLPRIGAYNGLDMERVIALHPDLIITWDNTFTRQLSALKQFNIPIYHTEPQDLTDIPKSMRDLGCLSGRQTLAAFQANSFMQRLAQLKQHFANQKPLKVFYQIGNYCLITINHQSWINQAITLCGGRNIFATAKLSAPEVTWEAVITADPEVIISDATNADWKLRWLRWSKVTAVKQHNLFAINPDLLERASPRLLEGIEQMCQYFKQSQKNLPASPRKSG